MSTHALATQWQGFDNARAACPDDPLAGGIAPADLAGRRTTLTGALNTLVNAYAAMPLDATQETWGTKEIAAREKQTAPLFQKVKYVTPKTEEQARLLKEFNALPSGGPTYAVVLAREDAKVAKAEQLLAAVRIPTAIADEKAYFGAYNKVRERIEAAVAATDTTEPTKTNKEAFGQLWTPFDSKLKGTATDRFTDCLGKLAALTTAADLVLKARVDAANKQIDDIGADTPGTPPVPATNAERSSRAVATSQIDPVILKQLPVDKKLAMLTGVRANGGPPAFTETPNNANDPERKATRDIYAILNLEEEFVKAEKVQQKTLIDELIKDHKAELQRARDEWPAMSDDDKVKIMEKVLAAHCKAMNFVEPKNPGGTGPNAGKPIVAKDTGRPTNNGGYEPSTDVININITGKLYADFELMMDLIIHENSHNMQIKLAARLSLPDTDSNKLTKDKTDPPYTQALMWQANYQPGADFLKGYIKSAENYASYQKQPLEDHSWQAGPKTARMLMKALAT